MNPSFQRLMRACAFALAVSAVSTNAAAQGGATSSLSGVVVDAGGGVVPGATVVVKDGGTGTQVRDHQQHRRPLLRARDRRRHLLGDGVALRLQDRGHQQPERRRRPAGLGEGRARGREPQRNHRRAEQQRHHQHADGDDLGDAQRRSDQQDADADAQRAERDHVPARRQHRRHQPRFQLQRPARLVRRHHARRRQQQRQLQQVHRRPVRDGDAAAGRGRGRHRHHRGGRRRRRRPRRGVDQLLHALGHQPVHRQRLRVLPRAAAEHQLLLQQAEQPAGQRRQAESVPASARAARS